MRDSNDPSSRSWRTLPEDIGYHRRGVVLAGYHPAREFYWIRPLPSSDSIPDYHLTILPDYRSGLVLVIDSNPRQERTNPQSAQGETR
jgi:hypothetical protein